MQDKDLINKIINNDRDAFRIFVDKYQKLVFNVCYNFLNNRYDADDITQEVFIEVYNKANTFKFESKISTWLYRIATNKSLNLIRKLKKEKIIKSIDNMFSPDSEKSIDIIDNRNKIAQEEIEHNEMRDILYSALGKLPKNQSTAFKLHKFENLAYKEIAEIMELSLSAVESLIHRAGKNLRKKLSNYYYS